MKSSISQRPVIVFLSSLILAVNRCAKGSPSRGVDGGDVPAVWVFDE